MQPAAYLCTADRHFDKASALEFQSDAQATKLNLRFFFSLIPRCHIATAGPFRQEVHLFIRHFIPTSIWRIFNVTVIASALIGSRTNVIFHHTGSVVASEGNICNLSYY